MRHRTHSFIRPTRPRVASLLSAVCLALCANIGLAGADGTMVRSADGTAVSVKDASRIVAIGGSVTEILYALGLERQIVAVDTSSLYPPNALRDKPNVGYMRALSPEGVLGLDPSLIIALEGSGPKEAIAVLESAHVPFLHVPESFTGEGILAKIKLVAAAAGAPERGACLAAAVGRDLDQLALLRKSIADRKRVMFVLSLVDGRPMVAGRGTAADGIIRLAGAINAIDAFEGYKQLGDEAVIASRPDAILVMQRPGAALDAATVFGLPAFSLTPAARTRSFVTMEGLYLLGFGPRTARAARDLASSLYPTIPHVEFASERNDPARLCGS
ncbi:MAG TPA: hemin ABC transporter substrate-binding protein [Xanthobacteraceae bacterium]|nr:hemin ABC transporter substrate-binding protein [Xanthobacteraceae bacterium]